MTPTPCQRTVLASSPSSEVTRCSCGHIHLSVGPVTIRMDEDMLHAAWHTLGDALRSLASLPTPSTSEVAHPAAAGRRAPGEWEQ
ncbi:hypothetical protein [Hyalangium rubrum]|uniref:Uncharacterized protein n=1 Tax=Hyalangium rubrum TaxID=3103134 RepID=A0ABU5GVN0_9BACT|nr:hypothetical protein [Hyalangium sp. s54d21]MDY7225242.1 hypothetical protein [Hyalangium sp. s54d21]